jgi:putative DNA primase/helicase
MITIFQSTDTGNGARIAHHAINQARFMASLPNARPWLIWNGGHWEHDRTDAIYGIATDALATIYEDARHIQDSDERKALVKWGLKSESTQRQRAALVKAHNPMAIDDSELDIHPWLLNARNGTLDLESSELRAHNRNDFLTKMLPFEYDASAACPMWDQFLEDVLPSPDLRQFIQCAVGYTLTGHTTEHSLFFAYGMGRNGKSTFFETIHALMGTYAQRMKTDVLMFSGRPTGDSATPTLARLPGARFVVASEIDQGRRLAESTVKDLTGNDTITARRLHGAPFDFKPTHKLWMYGNHKPVIRGTDDGIWRRICLVPFDVQIPKDKVDVWLPKKLKSELPGILAWAVRGCQEWRKNGALKRPADVTDATKIYRNEQDDLARFLDECCLVQETAFVTKKALYSEFVSWGGSGSKNVFGRRITARGFESARGTTGARIWRGLGLLGPEHQT